MSTVTYDQLKLNLAAFAVENGVLKATFRCPVTGRTVDASAPLEPARRPHDLAHLWQAARRGVTRVLGNILGPSEGGGPTGEEEQAAIVAAFETVRGTFTWDAGRGYFVCTGKADALMNPFDLVLRDTPLVRPADRDVAARVVWDIVRADREIRPAEERFVEATMGKDVAAMRSTPEVSKLDIEQLSASCRGTVLMLAMAAALSDEHRHQREQQRLARLAAWLDVREDRQESLRNAAAQKVIENVLLECYSDGVIDDAERARLTLLAERLGVNEALVAKVDVRLRQRGVHA